MAIVELSSLKAKFEPGDSPKSSDFINLIDTLAALPVADVAANGIPSGGTTGQVLVKVDGTNYNTQWSTTDLSGKQDVVANVSSTEIGYLDGVTSSIQTQINTKAPIADPTFTGTVSGVTKTHVGLGNVDNTTDANKPVSNATQTALDLKAPIASPTFTGTPAAPLAVTGTNTTQIATTSFVQQELSVLTSGAPAALNTLDELAAALGDDSNYAATITTALGNKQDKISGVSDTEIGYLDGVTSAIQTQLNGKQAIVANVSDTEIGYLDGVTSAIQTQLDAKDSSEQSMTIALSDEATPITAGTSKLTFRAPFAMTLTKIPRASLKTASTSGIPTVDINENGTSILSTKLTIDANEKTSTTAATAAVLSDTSIADDAELTFDIDVAGTGAIGLKVTIYYKKA